jgi:hypothetical protein
VVLADATLLFLYYSLLLHFTTPWNAFSDENRLVLSDFVEEYETPEQYVQSHIDLIKEASKNYNVPNGINSHTTSKFG